MSQTAPQDQKKPITQLDYLALIGLQEVARRLNERYEDVVRSMSSIVGEKDKSGHMADVASGYRKLDDALRILGVTVEGVSDA